MRRSTPTRTVPLVLALGLLSSAGPVSAQPPPASQPGTPPASGTQIARPATPSPAAARFARLKDDAMKDAANPRVWVVLGRECVLQKKYLDAIRFFEEALRRGSNEPKLRYHLAVLYRHEKQEDKASSVLAEQLALHPEDKEARALLVQSSTPACPAVTIGSLDELEPIARAERCYDLQASVNRALATYNLEKGAKLVLLPANSEKVVADLAKYGYLQFPAHEPAGKLFLTDVRGRVTCPVHGSGPVACAEGRKPPRLSRVNVPAGVLRSALARPDLTLQIEAAAVVARGGGPLDVLAEGLRHESDREALEAIFAAVEASAHGHSSSVLETALSGLLVRPDPVVRRGAAQALHAMGVRPKLLIEDAFGLLVENARGNCSNEFLTAVFGAVGPAAAPRLARELAKGDGVTMVPLLRAMAVVRDRQVVKALIAALGRGEQVFEFYRSDVRHTLAQLAGQDLGNDPQAWSAWMEKAFSEK